ncbi:unnamed protein product [Larinioides sclopetarius]|uniref:Uncharacterized protein n=1 Tax=Larinioides sclopetarius TaxID=280406 RepID=A0AAV2B082_9ARAC
MKIVESVYFNRCPQMNGEVSFQNSYLHLNSHRIKKIGISGGSKQLLNFQAGYFHDLV